jgi:hypothetical protein
MDSFTHSRLGPTEYSIRVRRAAVRLLRGSGLRVTPWGRTLAADQNWCSFASSPPNPAVIDLPLLWVLSLIAW